MLNEGTGSAGLVLRRSGGTSSRWIVHAGAGSTDLQFNAAGSNLVTINTLGRLTTLGGINFGADTLNTYDEGTWTPVITTSGVAPTTLTYTEQLGKYTQIGNVVLFSLRITILAFTLGSGTGAIRISLPSTVAAGNVNSTSASMPRQRYGFHDSDYRQLWSDCRSGVWADSERAG